jgi:3-mercaptopyruvate sulfurtransferase SseA
MRKLAAVAIASTFVASVAAAQMKLPPQPRVTATPQQTTTEQSPIKVEMARTQAPPPEVPIESARRIARNEAINLVKANKAIWVDVRSKESYDSGHIKGATSIPLTELPRRLKELPKNKEIITYCA